MTAEPPAIPQEWRDPAKALPYVAIQLRELNTGLLVLDQNLEIVEELLAFEKAPLEADNRDRALTGLVAARGQIDELRVRLTGRTAAFLAVAEELARG